MCVCVCVCECVCVCHHQFVWLGLFLCMLIRYIYNMFFYGYSFLPSWMFQHYYLDTYCFECLVICICFLFLYLHLFSACVCIFVFAPVQRKWACFTWKGALEIRSLLLFICCTGEYQFRNTSMYHTKARNVNNFVVAKRPHSRNISSTWWHPPPLPSYPWETKRKKHREQKQKNKPQYQIMSTIR